MEQVLGYDSKDSVMNVTIGLTFNLLEVLCQIKITSASFITEHLFVFIAL